ncbi:hypothetical protein TS85_01140 [Sphingomonas hengshuiensis]|uniref:Uncharacterized protein n=1 Tax=Sphingomonas hengshuiensis TaxID=1609977 RepID=A0A7U5CUI3_9SPHN|nr:hypothetical protein TS85_01140 [Sphingomonas hengshuiensis]
MSGAGSILESSPFPILPGTGRGTKARSGLVEGARHRRIGLGHAPSTMLRMVPLPVPGRIA